jgi:spore maturation protein CgeB
MVTQRTYEILASGGFLLTSSTSAINELFNIGKNLVASSSPEETVKLVKYYLNNPSERKKVAMQDRTALLGHSYKDRAQNMVDVLYKEGIIKKT